MRKVFSSKQGRAELGEDRKKKFGQGRKKIASALSVQNVLKRLGWSSRITEEQNERVSHEDLRGNMSKGRFVDTGREGRDTP